MTISEGFNENHPQDYEKEAIKPPFAMSELPDPQDFIDEDDESDSYQPYPIQKKTLTFSEFAKNKGDSVTDSEIVGTNLESVSTNLEPVSTNLEPVSTNLEPVGTNLESVSTNLEPVSTNLEPVGTNLESVSTNLEPVSTNLEPVSTNLESVSTNLEPVSTNLEPVSTNLEPVGTNLESVSTINVESVTEQSNTVIKSIITNQTPISTIKVLTNSLERFKSFYGTSGFRTLGDGTAYIFERWESVFEVDSHIADLNKMTLERNLIKEQLDKSLLENQNGVNSHHKEVESYLFQIEKINEETRALKEKVVLLSESSHDTQAIITLKNERDSYKTALESLVQQNANQKGQEATSTETWQRERERMLIEFVEGLKDTQKLAHEHSAELFNYAIDNALHLLYQDTKDLHKGKGWLSISELRPQAEFYILFRKHFQDFFKYAEKLKETEAQTETNNHV